MLLAQQQASTLGHNAVQEKGAHKAQACACGSHLCVDEVCKVLQPLLVGDGLKGRPDLTDDDGEAPAVVTCAAHTATWQGR